jgi:hypothetical protein
MSSVNITGLIKNALSQGFSLRDCLGELYDNSIDAGATRIVVSLVNGWLYFADNGRGMTRAGLLEASTWARNSEAGGHGRFGIGAIAAKIGLTKHDGMSVVLTKRDGVLSVGTVDWAECVATNTYVPTSRGPIGDDTACMRTYGLGRSGTIVAVQCAPTVYEALVSGSDVLTKEFSRMYWAPLKDGVSMAWSVRGDTKPLHDMDPLERTETDGSRLKTEDLTVWTNGGDLRAYLKHGRREFYYDFSGDAKKGKAKVETTEGWTELGMIRLSSRHLEGWNNDASDHGIHIMRGAKILERIAPAERGGAGGKRDSRHYKATSRHILQWTTEDPNRTVEFDRLMAVETNKNRINQANINVAIMKTVERICADFANDMMKDDKAADAAENTRKAEAEAIEAARREPTVEEPEPEVEQAGWTVEGDAIVVRGTDVEVRLDARLYNVEQIQRRFDRYGAAPFLEWVVEQKALDDKFGA